MKKSGAGSVAEGREVAGLDRVISGSQAPAHDVLLCVGTASNLDTPGRLKFESDTFYLKSAAEMAPMLEMLF